MPGTAIVYIRVSTEEQSKKGYSLPDQLEKCTQKAEEMGACDAVLCTDYAETAAHLDRPGLQRALELVATGRYAYFIALDVDRLARDLGDQLYVTEEIEKRARVEFVTHRRGDPGNPEDTLFYHIKGAFSQYERAKTRQRTIAGARQKAKSGKIVQPGGYPGHPGPYGYKYNKDPQNPKFTVVEEEAAVVRKIYRWVLDEGLGLQAIAARLNQERIPPPRGVKWYTSMVGRVLTKELYCGEFHNFKWRTVTAEGRTPSGRRRTRYLTRPVEERIPVKVPPIVTRKEWEMAQEIRRHNSLGTRKGRKHQYLLVGHVRCGECGRSYNSEPHSTGLRYRCIGTRKQMSSTPCANRSWPVHGNSRTPGLDDVLWEEISRRLKDTSLIEKELAGKRRSPDTAVRDKLEKELRELELHLGELRRHREALFEMRLENVLSEKEFRFRLLKVNGKADIIQQKLDEMRRKISAMGPVKMPDLHALQKAYIAKVESADFDLKREIIRKLNISAKVYRRRVEIFWPFSCAQKVDNRTHNRNRGYECPTLLCITREFPEPGRYGKIGIGLAPEMDKKLKQIAAERGVTQADLLREAVSWFLDQEIEKIPPRKRGKVAQVRRTLDLPEEHEKKIREIAAEKQVSCSYVIEYAVQRRFNL